MSNFVQKLKPGKVNRNSRIGWRTDRGLETRDEAECWKNTLSLRQTSKIIHFSIHVVESAQSICRNDIFTSREAPNLQACVPVGHYHLQSSSLINAPPWNSTN